MPVRLRVQLVSVAEDGSESAEDVLVLTKAHERLEQLGLTSPWGSSFSTRSSGELCSSRRRPSWPPTQVGEGMTKRGR